MPRIDAVDGCTVSVTHFGAEVGGIVEGTFEGVLFEYRDGQDLTAPTTTGSSISGKFRVVRDD